MNYPVIDWDNVPDLRAEHANLSELLTVLESLLDEIQKYEAWVQKHGYTSLSTVEGMLDTIQTISRDMEGWVIGCKRWKKCCDEQGKGVNPELCNLLAVLDEAGANILPTIVKANDPTIERPDDPSFVYIAPGTEVSHFSPLAVAQLELGIGNIRKWEKASSEEHGEGNPIDRRGPNGGTMLFALMTAVDRLTNFVTAASGNLSQTTFDELLRLDGEVAALCQVTGITLPVITYAGINYEFAGYCKTPYTRSTMGVYVFHDPGWFVTMSSLRRTVELKMQYPAPAGAVGELTPGPGDSVAAPNPNMRSEPAELNLPEVHRYADALLESLRPCLTEPVQRTRNFRASIWLRLLERELNPEKLTPQHRVESFRQEPRPLRETLRSLYDVFIAIARAWGLSNSWSGEPIPAADPLSYAALDPKILPALQCAVEYLKKHVSPPAGPTEETGVAGDLMSGISGTTAKGHGEGAGAGCKPGSSGESARPKEETDYLRRFLNRVEPTANDLPDPLGADVNSSGQSGSRVVPVRVRGLLAQLAEQEREIVRGVTRQRAAVTQDFLSRGLSNTTAYDSKLRELYRKQEADRSSSRESWYRGLAPVDQTSVDEHCLALAGEVLLPLFSPDVPERLRGPLARLALEYAALVRRFAAGRQEMEKSLADRGLGNRTVVDSLLQGSADDEAEAKSRLIGRWYRELTPEQGAAMDAADVDADRRKTGGRATLTQGKPEGASTIIEPTQGEFGNHAGSDDPALSGLQYDILEALYRLKASDAEKRMTAEAIAPRVGGDTTPASCKAPISDLKSRGLVFTKEGRGGGCWLSPEGRAFIKRVRKL